jgi:hypothetical protein
MAESKKSRTELLREKFAKIKRELESAEARDRKRARTEDTRLKVLVGACFLADAEIHDETRARIKTVCERAAKVQRDRDFLKQKGWL